MGFTPRYNLRKYSKSRRCQIKDGFSRLPDDLITSNILSRLMPREAGKCCFISRRWRSLWKQSVSCRFIFTYFQGEDFTIPFRFLEKERKHFVSWVNNFLNFPQHNPTIKEFIVRFDLDSRHSSSINKWMNFAFRKGVERLELDFSPQHGLDDNSYYVFPGIETLSGLLGSESSRGMNLSTSCRSSGLHNLRDVCFKYVEVDGASIEYMLSKCHSLERLSVKHSKTLVDLKVCGKFVGLKHLEILDCENAKTIMISISSLVSLKYRGSRRALHMGHVPSLSELCVGGDYCGDFLRSGGSNLKCVSQLKKLKLFMTCKVVKECVSYPTEFENLLSLEQLEVTMEMYNGLFLLWPTILIKAAPALQRFAVKLKHDKQKILSAHSKLLKKEGRWQNMDMLVVGCTPGLSRKMKRGIKRASKVQHKCLKVVEICPFLGNESDLNLARHLLRNPFQSLEQLVLVTKPGAPFKISGSHFFVKAYQKRSRERANLVRKWLPSSTQLVIL